MLVKLGNTVADLSGAAAGTQWHQPVARRPAGIHEQSSKQRSEQLQTPPQATVVAAVFLGLAVGTWALVGPIFGFLQGALGALGACSHKYPYVAICRPTELDSSSVKLTGILPEGWFKTWRKTWPILGAFYMAAGLYSDMLRHCWHQLHNSPNFQTRIAAKINISFELLLRSQQGTARVSRASL